MSSFGPLSVRHPPSGKVRTMSKFVIKESSDGQYYFNYVAGNGEVVATSERYTRKANAEHGAQVIKDGAAEAPIVDETS